MIRRVDCLVAALVLLLAAAACRGSGDDTDDAAVDDREEWCAVVAEVDERFDAADSSSSEEFRLRQARYAEIGTMLDRLSTSIEFVDASARADVHATIAFAANYASAFVTATDEDSAEAAIEAIMTETAAELGDQPLPGSGWLLDNCDVDINS